MDGKSLVSRRLAAAMLCVLAGCGLRPSEYTATACLHIDKSPFAIVDAHAGGPQDRRKRDFEEYKALQSRLIQSPPVLAAALKRPEIAKLKDVRSGRVNAASLARMVDVKFPGKAEIMVVSVSDSDAATAAALANGVVDAYMSEVVDAEKTEKLAGGVPARVIVIERAEVPTVPSK